MRPIQFSNRLAGIVVVGFVAVLSLNAQAAVEPFVAQGKAVLVAAPLLYTNAFRAPAWRPGTTRVLLVTGQEYPGHPWRQTAPALAEALEKDARLQVQMVDDPYQLSTLSLDAYQTVVIHFMNWKTNAPDEKARENLRRAVAAGKGLALVHFACGAWQDWPEFGQLAGRAWNPKLRGHDPRGKFKVEIADAQHSIMRGLVDFEADDELYTCLAGDRPIQILAKARSKVDQKEYPMAFVLQYGQGRVFHSVLGHDLKAIAIPEVLELYRRGIVWTAGLAPVATGK